MNGLGQWDLFAAQASSAPPSAQDEATRRHLEREENRSIKRTAPLAILGRIASGQPLVSAEFTAKAETGPLLSAVLLFGGVSLAIVGAGVLIKMFK